MKCEFYCNICNTREILFLPGFTKQASVRIARILPVVTTGIAFMKAFSLSMTPLSVNDLAIPAEFSISWNSVAYLNSEMLQTGLLPQYREERVFIKHVIRHSIVTLTV